MQGAGLERERRQDLPSEQCEGSRAVLPRTSRSMVIRVTDQVSQPGACGFVGR